MANTVKKVFVTVRCWQLGVFSKADD